METVKLYGGIELPRIGMGTWQLTDRQLLKSLISAGYELGYRMIDTAAAYSNEISISRAILEAGILREDIMISDKVWNTSRGYKAVQEACKKSLKKLKTDYLDLYLIHWPASKKLYSNWEEINADTWRGMEQLLKDGLVRSIGVCNFKEHDLSTLKKTACVMPMVNQIEYHPGMNRMDLYNYCVDENICVEASSPLGNGAILNNVILNQIAQNKGKSVAQICLRWELQKGIIVIPKTSNIDRLKSNIEVFDFTLADKEMKLIDDIPFCGGIGIDSDEVTDFG